jgi:uncharacterized protein (TIGR02246 family)
LASTLAACTPAPAPPPDTSADTAAIGQVRSKFESALNMGDVDTLMGLYTSDAVVMEEHQPAMTGHDAIQAYYQGLMSQATPKITLKAEETKVLGEMAYDRGTFTFVLTPKAEGAPAMTENGKYLVLLQTGTDGTWKLAREIGNSSDAMPPAPAAAAPAAPKKKK